jgi:hypothetical protein
MGLFGKDQMTIQLDKYSFAPGDIVKGYVKLNLKKPLQGRKLVVALRCIRTDTCMVRTVDSKGIPSSHMEKVKTTLYNFEVPLDETNTYFSEMYPFEITIPADILNTLNLAPQHQGFKIMGFTIPTGNAPLSTVIEWTVYGQLDVPLKIDVKAEQQIVITPSGGGPAKDVKA